MLRFFLTTDKLKDFQFPDQDFVIEYFRNRWQPLSWKYNAIKTMEYWHPRLWVTYHRLLTLQSQPRP